jgi:flagellar biosynthesis/type III secretory pathway protein FliH
MTQKKKPNKKQREQRRAHDADIFNKGFTMGYEMGKQQGREEVAEFARRETLKWAHRGR